jgi:hypothetical protein
MVADFCRIDGSGVLVAEGVTPVQAHMDVHFRLMHHDLLAELIGSTCSFKALGGIGMLNARDRRQVGGVARVYWCLYTVTVSDKTTMVRAVCSHACCSPWQ